MLEYTIYILEKVSIDVVLFSKELKKAIAQLTSNEIVKLKEWFDGFTSDKKELQVFNHYF
jgi:hypothetical protein